jgi:RecJ-like exonuclease
MPIPIFKECKQCDGTGLIVTNESELECVACHGHGEVLVGETTHEQDKDNIDGFDEDEWFHPY